MLGIFAAGYWYIKKGAATEKGAPMPPLTPAPGTAPGWQLSRSKVQQRMRRHAPLAVARLQRPTGRPGVPEAHAMARLIPRIPLHYPLPRNAV